MAIELINTRLMDSRNPEIGSEVDVKAQAIRARGPDELVAKAYLLKHPRYTGLNADTVLFWTRGNNYLAIELDDLLELLIALGNVQNDT